MTFFRSAVCPDLAASRLTQCNMTAHGRQATDRPFTTDTVEKVGATNLKAFFQLPTVRRMRCFVYPAKNYLKCLSAPKFS